jgi:hypothetical protein
VTLGVLLLGEPFNARMAVAAALVLLGVAIVKGRSRVAVARPEVRVEQRPASIARQQPRIKRAV